MSIFRNAGRDKKGKAEGRQFRREVKTGGRGWGKAKQRADEALGAKRKPFTQAEAIEALDALAEDERIIHDDAPQGRITLRQEDFPGLPLVEDRQKRGSTPRRKDSHPVGRFSRTKTPSERVLLAMHHDGTLEDAYPYEHGLLVQKLKRKERSRRKAKAGRHDRVQRGMKARGKH